MMKKIYVAVFLLFIVVILCGCATSGPVPTDQGYAKAVDKLPAAKYAVYKFDGCWTPNRISGYVCEVIGSLFITPEQLIFTEYDSVTERFFPNFSVAYANISWITIEQHGLSRFIRIQTNNSVHSFMCTRGYTNNGEDADKDEAMHFIQDKCKK